MIIEMTKDEIRLLYIAFEQEYYSKYNIDNRKSIENREIKQDSVTGNT